MVKKELTEKDVSRIWSNEDLKLKKVKAMSQPLQVGWSTVIRYNLIINRVFEKKN